MASGSNGDGAEEGRRWFNDRRFNLSQSAGVGRLRQNVNQFIADINQTARQNPELLGQLRTQLQAISDLVNAHSQTGNENNPQPASLNLPSTSRQNSSESVPTGRRGDLPQMSPSNNRHGDPGSSEDDLSFRDGQVALDLEAPGSDESRNEESWDSVPSQPPDPLPANDHNEDEDPADPDQDDWQRNLASLVRAREKISAGRAMATVRFALRSHRPAIRNFLPGSYKRNELSRISELLQSPEMQRIMKILLGILPFVFIVFIKMFIDHFAGLFTLTVFTLLFFYANKTLHRFVSERAEAKVFDALKVIVVLNAGLSNLYLFFRDEKLWKSLLFQAPPELDLAEHVGLCVVFWIVLSTDFVVKFGGMIFKALVGLLPRKIIGFKRKRDVYQWIEYSAQLYRHALPILPWWHYLMSTHSRHGFITGLSFTLVLFYLAIKCGQGVGKLKQWKRSTRGVFQTRAYGQKPTSSEMFAAGVSCSICYTEYRDPVILSCKHVFCEECISTWFDREKTCPMCRAEVSKEDVSWKCGSTTWLVQVF